MSFRCSKSCKIVLDHLRLGFNTVTIVIMCNIVVKYHYASRSVCAYTHDFLKLPRCSLIGACALIRTNMVHQNMTMDSSCVAIAYQFHGNISVAK